MAKSAMTAAIVETILIAALGGVILAITSAVSVTSNLGASHVTSGLLFWQFVTGVFVVSSALFIGTLLARFTR